jgi:type IV pilus assembly protein PilM
MADTQTTVAINLGSQRISMAVFENSKNGQLKLKNFESDTITADPALEASRDAQMRVALEEMIEKLKVSKSKVRYAISGQSVFTRFVKLPPLQDDNVERIVTFEAQQHVPFPISEVVWDYEMIESSGDKEVIIVAIKEDALDAINDTVTGLGLTTIEVDVAPTALYNAYRHSYGIPEEPTLIIDIGAKTTNLLYVEGKRFFTRSVAIGGSTITSAIAKEYNITFPEAELQKINNGLVALSGEHTESMDEAHAALAMVIRNALTRLPAEIARTTNYFRSQHGGSPPKKVILAGGGANLPYTLEFFQEKLNLPIDFFNPLNHVSIANGIDLEMIQAEAHTMGELIGLGLRGLGKSIINIDLVPSAVRTARAEQKRKPFLISAAAIFVASFAIWTAFQYLAATKAQERSRTMSETQQSLAPVAAQIRGLINREKEMGIIADSFTKIESDHVLWFDLMNELSSAFASDAVWLTEMTPLYNCPVLEMDKKAESTKPQFAVKSDFISNQNKQSAINDMSQPAQAKPGNRPVINNRLTPTKAENLAQAILIKGFWRENPRSQNLVSDLIKRLRENSTVFRFTTKEASGKEITITDEQLYNSIASSANEKGDLAFPFEITLPLARPFSVK